MTSLATYYAAIERVDMSVETDIRYFMPPYAAMLFSQIAPPLKTWFTARLATFRHARRDADTGYVCYFTGEPKRDATTPQGKMSFATEYALFYRDR